MAATRPSPGVSETTERIGEKLSQANTEVFENVDDFLVAARNCGNRSCWKFAKTDAQPMIYIIAGTRDTAEAAWQAHTNPSPPSPIKIMASDRVNLAITRLEEHRKADAERDAQTEADGPEAESESEDQSSDEAA